MNTSEWISRKVSKLQAVIAPILVSNASRRTLEELKAIIDPRVSDVEGGKRAKRVADWYAKSPIEYRRECWLLMSENFKADPEVAKTAQAKYAAAVGTPEEAVAEVRLRKSTVSPRRRLLQRLRNIHPSKGRSL